jgi:hypothetical protein
VSVEDKQINALARRVLTSFWVDITAVYVSTAGGTMRVSGHLQRMTATQREFLPEALFQLDRRLRTVPGVRNVQYYLDNWQQANGGQWLPRAEKPATELPVTPAPTPKPVV